MLYCVSNSHFYITGEKILYIYICNLQAVEQIYRSCSPLCYCLCTRFQKMVSSSIERDFHLAVGTSVNVAITYFHLLPSNLSNPAMSISLNYSKVCPGCNY